VIRGLTAGGAMAQGAIPETPQELAAVPLVAATRGVLPRRADLSALLPMPRSQAWTSTCVSWAATYAAASSWLRNEKQQADITLSPSFTYPLVGGTANCQGGTKISATLDVLRDVGALPIRDFVFDGGWCGRKPTPAELEQAAKYRIRSWGRVDATDVGAVASQIARGRVVIFTMPIGPAFLGFTGPDIFRQIEKEPGSAEHAMVAIGYDQDRQAFRVMNSMGRRWGDDGYAWISYEVWMRQVKIGFVIE
jgi:hypothetical protein